MYVIDIHKTDIGGALFPNVPVSMLIRLINCTNSLFLGLWGNYSNIYEQGQ